MRIKFLQQSDRFILSDATDILKFLGTATMWSPRERETKRQRKREKERESDSSKVFVREEKQKASECMYVRERRLKITHQLHFYGPSALIHILQSEHSDIRTQLSGHLIGRVLLRT
jgi:hypothetical protein